MVTLSLTSITGAVPPQVIIPSFADAPLGWLIGVIVLLGPFAYMVYSWHKRNGRWLSLLSQVNTLSFWLYFTGSIIAAIGLFSLLGIIPAWQGNWESWHLAIVKDNPGADLTIIDWNVALHQQYAAILQICAAIAFVLGGAAIFLAQQRLVRRMSHFRRQGPDDWLVAMPDTGSMPAQHGNSLTHPLSGRK